MMKKLTRGINEKFADAFKECELYSLYENHRDELFIGVRNNYLSVYHNCNSLARVTYVKKVIHCETDRYYLTGKHYEKGDKEKIWKPEPKEICDRYEEIKKNSDIFSDERKNWKKKALSKLVLLNNANQDSNWFCIDTDYIKCFKNKKERDEAGFSGRFDIIALSKEQPHRVALIKVNYGGGTIDEKMEYARSLRISVNSVRKKSMKRI
jgi:hypothetical protein